MAKHHRGAPPSVNRRGGVLPATVLADLTNASASGQWSRMATIARTITTRHPLHVLGWKVLGKALVAQGHNSEALAPLRKAARIMPGDADTQNDLGQALHATGQHEEALAAYRKALQIDPKLPEAHANLGNLLAIMGHRQEAIAAHQQAIALAPANAANLNNLGSVYYDLGQFAEAETAYRQAVTLHPAFIDAWVNLGTVCRATGKWLEAENNYRHALALDPEAPSAMFALASLCGKLQQNDEESIALLQRLVQRLPGHVDAHMELGNTLLRLNRIAESWQSFRLAQALRPLTTWHATGAKPSFSVVFLDTPGAGSTPVDYLAGRAAYDRHFYCVVPDEHPAHLDLLREKADVVFNIIADADNGTPILPFAERIADSLGCPVINHPRRILDSDRASMATRLENIPLCRVPRTLRLSGNELMAGKAVPLTLPVLIRVAGTHGGDEFEKCSDWPSVAAIAARQPEASYYVSEYLDYRSADGQFRKYRLIGIDGQLFPYHLAIHADWKVHYFRTDMEHQAWMREEEEKFLREPETIFDASHWQALREIAAATGLDYCGIDCGLDSEGRIVVFEANATMLVHDEQEAIFTYKNPYIARIKDAFDAMVSRRVSGIA